MNKLHVACVDWVDMGHEGVESLRVTSNDKDFSRGNWKDKMPLSK
jgi:hypothetical protein